METTNNATQVYIAAMVRAFVIAVVTGISAGSAALAAGADDRTAIITGVSAGASALLVRLVGEGGYDANRAKNGNVHPGDVGRGLTTTTIVNTPIVATETRTITVSEPTPPPSV